MCFGGGSTPSAPKPPIPAPPPPAPDRPQAPAPAPPVPVTLEPNRQLGIVRKKSSAEESGKVSQGTGQFRIPLNVGTAKSGGLNI